MDLVAYWGENDDDEEDEIPEILPQNRTAWSVFVRCDWDINHGFGGAVYNGLKAGEITRVMDVLQIPAAERAECYDKVRFCVRIAQPELNRKISNE